MEGPRAWWGGGLAQHAGHTEAVLQQRQLKDPSQRGGVEGWGREGGKEHSGRGWKRRKRGQEQGSEHEKRKKSAIQEKQFGTEMGVHKRKTKTILTTKTQMQ